MINPAAILQKTLICLLLFSIITPPSSAKPHWKRILLEAGAVVGASTIQIKGTSYCQRGDVERCAEGYGSRRGFNVFASGMSGGLFAAAQKCHKDHLGWKFCYAVAFGMPAAQAGFGIHDFLSYKPKEGTNAIH